MIRVGFVSLGCAKNLVDSEVMATRLTSAGFALAPSPARADVILVNTCAFIRDAQAESVEAILEACERKRRGQCRAVVVAGCLPQRHRDELARLVPEADAFVGLDALNRIGAILRRVLRGEAGIVDVTARAGAVIRPPPGRLLFTGGPFAYVKVADGCNHGCRFCAIPAIRGRYRSRPLRQVVAEAEDLLARGVRELNLISQDVTAYGRDLGGRADLPALLLALGRIGGRFWIRLLYGHPAGVSDRLLAAMGEVGQVCRYLDLPIQHSDTAVLRAMGRPGSADQLRRLFARIRAALPGVVLRTTCLVGFPGETSAQFENLLSFAAEIRFDHLGVFAYSREDGTPAADDPRRVPASVAARRRARLLAAQRVIVGHRLRGRVGTTDNILVERLVSGHPGCWIGRSAAQAPEVDGGVRLDSHGARTAIRMGDFAAVRYIGRRGYDMRAAIAS